MTVDGAPRGLTIRWRLTVAFGSIAFASGALIITILYLFMRFVPTYISDSPDDRQDPVPTPYSTAGPTAPGGGVSQSLQIRNVSEILDTLLWAGIAILLIITLLACWAGWILSGRIVRPIARIGEAARSAGAGRLDHRIDLNGPADELKDLADTFDRTLDRLEHAFSAHERFAAGAAHELRTPLATTKTLLEIARAHPESVDLPSLIDDLEKNNGRSIATVQALLDLTSVEAARFDKEPVDLALVARSAVSRLAPQDVAVSFTSEPVVIAADQVLVSTLVQNLIQNAVQHNDNRATLSVDIVRTARGGSIRVENTGAVLTPDELSRLTEPMYRVRRTNTSGVGLGLAISKSIADAHGAELLLELRPGGGLVASAEFLLWEPTGER